MSLDQTYRELVSGQWRGPVAAALRGGLSALEHPYRWAVARRNLRFDLGEEACKVAAPVISVGNLTVGGTGKTPLVAWLVQWYHGRGVPVTVISRGYGSQGGQPNDEALELSARLPGIRHLQNCDRARAAREALATNPRQILILDDAFQHRRLARDLDIVLLDALAPFGYGRLLPRGLLREPVEALARADVVALSRSDAAGEHSRNSIRERVRKVAPQALWLELIHQPTRLIAGSGLEKPLDTLRAKPVAAFCGIGNPAGFRHTLEQAGASIAGWRELPDHFAYAPADLRSLEKWAAEQASELIVCTRKDLVKIQRDTLGGKALWALEIELAITRGQPEFAARLAELAAQFHST